MATVLMRMGLRQALIGNKGLLVERKLAPTICTGFLDHNNTSDGLLQQPDLITTTTFASPCKFQYNTVRQMSSSKRNVHHTRTSASLDEDHKSDSESDSDDEDVIPRSDSSSRAQSHFWRRKMRTLHSHLDVNKDGVISYDDFALLGERFAKLGHLTSGQKDEFQIVLRKMWTEQWGEIDPYNLVDVEKYLHEMHHVLEDKSLRRKVHHFLPYLFKAVDKDNSGEISVQEFKLFFRCLGLDNDDAVVSFSYIDTNEDGKISQEEFIKLGRDFFLTEDHAKPSKHFWGPLVD